MIKEIKTSALIDIIKTHNDESIFLIAPNYEERSMGVLDKIIELPVEILHKIQVKIIKLQSNNHRVELLEVLKKENLEIAKSSITNKKILFSYKEFNYPDDYSERSIETFVEKLLENPHRQFLIDISSLPSRITLLICKILTKKNTPVCLFYTHPLEYPQIKHPQAMGQAKGFFTDTSISELLKDYDHSRGILIVFPSDLGYGAKLISEQVSQFSFDQFFFIYWRVENIMFATYILSGNQALLQTAYGKYSNNVINHFTLVDGIRKLSELCDSIIEHYKKSQEKKVVIIAPFGPKPLLVGSLLVAEKIKATCPNIVVEIALSSSFQYTSLYSLGKGNTTMFQISANK